MTSIFRWRAATSLLVLGLALQSTASSEELCSQCAQKDLFPHAQKFDQGDLGVFDGKGHYQKGPSQKGIGHEAHSRSKDHKWFYSEHPPAAEIVESVAVRRVPVPRQVNFRIQQESGQLRAESAAAPTPESGAAPTDDINQRLTVLEKHVARLYESLDKLVTQLQQ